MARLRGTTPRAKKRPPFFKGRSSTGTSPPPVRVTETRTVSSSDPLSGQVADLRKELQRERRTRAMDKMTAPIKKIFPSGIQYPDDMVKNRHLYTGGSGKTRFLK